MNKKAATYLERFVIRSGRKIRFVFPDEVDWIGAEGNYVRLYTGAQTHLLRESMSRLAEQLDPRTFVRIHRSTIVNIARIRELESVVQGEYVVTLNNGAQLNSSRAFRAHLESALRIS